MQTQIAQIVASRMAANLQPSEMWMSRTQPCFMHLRMPGSEDVERTGRRPQCAVCKRQKRGHCGTERAAKGCLENAGAAGLAKTRERSDREAGGSSDSRSTAAPPSSSQVPRKCVCQRR